MFNMRVVQSFGLTDGFLARVNMRSDKPAHKYGLNPLADDICRIDSQYPPGRGMYRKAVADGRAPGWVAENIDSIEEIERKVYNRHDFIENLRLASAFPRISVVSTRAAPVK